MDYKEKLITSFWNFFDNREFDRCLPLFHDNFTAIWETTKEHFKDKKSFINVNKEYPGKWNTKLKKVIITEDETMSLVHVFSMEKGNSPEFYVTTFYEFKENLIYQITEYWATCESAPAWRKKYTRHFGVEN